MRLPANGEAMPDLGPEQDIIIEGTGGDKPVFDARGNVIQIEHPDGSITISLDGRPIEDSEHKRKTGWFDNLVDDLDDMELSRICEELIRGVEDDKMSRQDWVEERAKGIRLLGLSLESPSGGAAGDGAPLDGMSKVRHPLLQEAVLRFQANARAELLPTDGPAKIRNDSNNSTVDQDQLANALEKDFNHYLTVIAKEYYPDTDRMLLMLGFGGTAFKKVYFCPLRNRPVSEHVYAKDLIVNNDATDLSNAKRVTHRVMMRPSVVKRLQILGVYREVELGTPLAREYDAVKQEKMAQQGIADTAIRPDDRDREIYECYCELDVEGFEHKAKGKETGLEIPYRVTIDVSAKQILSIVRNYEEDTKELPEAKTTFVKYTFVPGFGFYDIGLLNILGNTTAAATAAWRELLDLGMYANFPGFLISKQGARQQTNILRVPPGGSAQVETGGGRIQDAVMPLPYSTQAAPSLMALVENMVQTGQRVGGTAELPSGEGRQDAPVGTTLALIEGATKILNSVHKRMHAAQAEELQLLADCFREHPESFWQKNRSPAYPWDEQTFLRALEDCNLIPQADPNTASQIQRLMKVGALLALSQMAPSLYDPISLHQTAIRSLGFGNPEEFMAPPSAMANPPPELVKMQQEGAAKLQEAQAKTMLAQAKMHETVAKAENEKAKVLVDASKGNGKGRLEPLEAVKAKTALMDAQTRAKEADVKHADAALSAHERAEDRRSKEHLATMSLAKDVLLHHSNLSADAQGERARMDFEDRHKMADREARAQADAVKAEAMSKSNALD